MCTTSVRKELNGTIFCIWHENISDIIHFGIRIIVNAKRLDKDLEIPICIY